MSPRLETPICPKKLPYALKKCGPKKKKKKKKKKERERDPKKLGIYGKQKGQRTWVSNGYVGLGISFLLMKHGF